MANVLNDTLLDNGFNIENGRFEDYVLQNL